MGNRGSGGVGQRGSNRTVLRLQQLPERHGAFRVSRHGVGDEHRKPVERLGHDAQLRREVGVVEVAQQTLFGLRAGGSGLFVHGASQGVGTETSVGGLLGAACPGNLGLGIFGCQVRWFLKRLAKGLRKMVLGSWGVLTNQSDPTHEGTPRTLVRPTGYPKTTKHHTRNIPKDLRRFAP